MSDVLLPLLLSVFTWAYPQPQHSAGLIVIYGSDRLVAANAQFHGYSLDGYAFGLAAISPAMLGRVAWVRVPGGRWLGPGLIVDVVSRKDAADSIYGRHEIAEVTWDTAEALGFANGGRAGEAWFGVCPPHAASVAEPYAPPKVWDYAPYEHTPSFCCPYPAQQRPADCSRSVWPVGGAVMR